MLYYKLVLILIVMLSGGSTMNLYAFDLEPFHSENKIEAEFSEELGVISAIHLSPSQDYINNRSGTGLTSFKYSVNTSEYSKSKAYFSENRFIEPGLSLSNIIFPFHIFL